MYKFEHDGVASNLIIKINSDGEEEIIAYVDCLKEEHVEELKILIEFANEYFYRLND